MLKFLKNIKAFTLVELMVVIAIIGILSAVAIPNFKKYKEKAKMTEVTANLSTWYTAFINYEMDTDTYTGTTLTLLGLPLMPNNKFEMAAGGVIDPCGTATTLGTTCGTKTASTQALYATSGTTKVVIPAAGGTSDFGFGISTVGKVMNSDCKVYMGQDKGIEYIGAGSNTTICK